VHPIHKDIGLTRKQIRHSRLEKADRVARRDLDSLGAGLQDDCRMSTDAEEADAAITKAVTTFVNEIGSLFDKWEDVSPAYIVEVMLLELSEEVSSRFDEIKEKLGPDMDPEALKLLDAMAVYADDDSAV
jgi:hypothetical protein